MSSKMTYLKVVVLVIAFVGSVQAVDIWDPMVSADISPSAIYSSTGNEEIWPVVRSIDRSLTTAFGWMNDDGASPLLTQTVVYDMGSVQMWGVLNWWNRATGGDLFAANVDVYTFTNDDPTDTPILSDMDLVATPHSKDNDDIYRHSIDITPITVRYIQLVFDDGRWGGGYFIQGSEIAFRTVTLPQILTRAI